MFYKKRVSIEALFYLRSVSIEKFKTKVEENKAYIARSVLLQSFLKNTEAQAHGEDGMQKNISGTIFYSSLFAIGGAPTIAMLIIQAQTANPEIIQKVLLGLTISLACILIPIILIQNSLIFFNRHRVGLNEKIKPVCTFYLVLDALCLLYWLAIQFL